MADLSPPDPELERFYRADRRIPSVDPALAARVLGRVQVAAAAAGAATATSWLVKPIAAKAAVVIAVASFLGGAIAGGAIVALSSEPSVAPVAPDPQPDVEQSTRPDPSPRAPSPDEPMNGGNDLADDTTETTATTEATPDSGARPPSSRRREPPSSLTAERRVLETARAALAREHVAHARALLERHRRVFETGELIEEREGLEVEVEFAARRWERVVRLADAFLSTHPNSLYRGRIGRLRRQARERSHTNAEGNDGPRSPRTSEGQPPVE